MITRILDVVTQSGLAVAFYAGVMGVVRLMGKRLVGQVAPFDFVILIQVAVVLQNTLLRTGRANSLTFVVTVLVVHRLLAFVTARSRRARWLIRGRPRPLVRDGRVSWQALEEEGLTLEDLLAGLRKLGHGGVESIRLATLEETGHISAVVTGAPARHNEA